MAWVFKPRADPVVKAAAGVCRYAEEWWRLTASGIKHSDCLDSKMLALAWRQAKERLASLPADASWARRSNRPVVDAMAWAGAAGWSWVSPQVLVKETGEEMSLVAGPPAQLRRECVKDSTRRS